MNTTKTNAPITVHASGLTAVYRGNGEWAIKSRRHGRTTMKHGELLGLLPDNTRPRRGPKAR